MKSRFRWTESDREFGSAGWLPESMPEGFAATGKVFAHDVIEHGLADSAGGFEGEMQALGACIATRAATGDVGTAYIPEWEDHIASDIWTFVRERFVYGAENAATCPHRVRVPRDIDQAMRDCFRRALKIGRDEDRVDGAEPLWPIFQRVMPNALAWMRHGWRVAQKKMRAAGVDKWAVQAMFNECAERCPRGEYEGQVLEVYASLAAGRVRFSLPTEEL